MAWSVDFERRNGRVVILAVDTDHLRHGLGTALCGHDLEQISAAGAEVAMIGTGGDEFHAPARTAARHTVTTPVRPPGANVGAPTTSARPQDACRERSMPT